MAISSKVVTVWPAALRDVEVANNAPADAELPHTLAGRARWLYEMAVGGPAASGEDAKVPLNPQGLVGHDHSGPPYGTALRHPILGVSGGGHDPTLWSHAVNSWLVKRPFTEFVTFRIRTWVKPFAISEAAPYSRGTVVVRAVAEALSSTLRVALATNGSSPARENVTVTTTPANFELTNTLPLRPGWNDTEVEFHVAGADSVIVLAWGVFQTAKRSH